MIAEAAIVGAFLAAWYLLHRTYRADLANAKAVMNDRIEAIKAESLEATAIAMSAVDSAIDMAEQAQVDVEWSRIVIAAQSAELDRIRTRHVLLPTLDGIRAEAAERGAA